MPDREVVHVVLGADPRVHVPRVTSAQLTREIFPVHVVKQFCHLAHVEDIKVEKIICVYKLTQHCSSGRIFVDEEDFLYGGWEDGGDLVEDLLDDGPGLRIAINDQSKARDLLSPRDDGDIILEEEVQVRLKDLVESVSVGEEDERTSCLCDSARQTQHPETNKALTILQSHVKVMADTRLSGHVALL